MFSELKKILMLNLGKDGDGEKSASKSAPLLRTTIATYPEKLKWNHSLMII